MPLKSAVKRLEKEMGRLNIGKEKQIDLFALCDMLEKEGETPEFKALFAKYFNADGRLQPNIEGRPIPIYPYSHKPG